MSNNLNKQQAERGADQGASIEAERADFEAWSRRVAPAYGFERNGRGHYIAYPVHAGWAAWQASAARTPSAPAGAGELPPLPPLPSLLIDRIGDYGMARTDGMSEVDRVHLWETLINAIKGYAKAYAHAAISSDRAQLAAKGQGEPVGETSFMPGTTGFTMAAFQASDVPPGTKLYLSAPASAQPADYQIREIGEGDWRRVSKVQMESVVNDPHMDYRVLYAASVASAQPAERHELDEEVLATLLWLYRRLPRGYGRQAVIETPIQRLANRVGIKVDQDLTERGPTPVSAAPLAVQAQEADQSEADKFCDANCVWTDHAPGCAYSASAQDSAEGEKP